MRGLLSILLAASASAQGIEVPSIGVIVDSSSALRLVQGVAGSFLLGPANMRGVLSAACSEQLCLAKTDSKILSTTGESDAPPGPAFFGFSRDEAIVFFPEPRVFALWHNDVLDPLDWVVEGEVLSIRPSGREAEIAVRKDGQVWIVRPDGSVVDSIADSAGPVLLLPEGVVFATSNKLVLRRRDGAELRFELADTQSLTTMGLHYAAIGAGGSIYALRTEPGREGLFLLPGSVP